MIERTNGNLDIIENCGPITRSIFNNGAKNNNQTQVQNFKMEVPILSEF